MQDHPVVSLLCALLKSNHSECVLCRLSGSSGIICTRRRLYMGQDSKDTTQHGNSYGCPGALCETALRGSGDTSVHTTMFHQGILQMDPIPGTIQDKYFLSPSFLVPHCTHSAQLTQTTLSTSKLHFSVGESRER